MFIQQEWIQGDPGQPPPPPERKFIRNTDWKHMYIEDVLSMPDKYAFIEACSSSRAFAEDASFIDGSTLTSPSGILCA